MIIFARIAEGTSQEQGLRRFVIVADSGLSGRNDNGEDIRQTIRE